MGSVPPSRTECEQVLGGQWKSRLDNDSNGVREPRFQVKMLMSRPTASRMMPIVRKTAPPTVLMVFRRTDKA